MADTAEAVLHDGSTIIVTMPGLDHLGAMHSAVVLPILTGWLQKAGWVRPGAP